MSQISIIRTASGKNTTLSHLYLNGIFLCFLLEDSIRERKIPGAACIPEGEYQMQLNTTAGMNRRYKDRYPALHRGMLEISGIPDFDLVFLHIGNYHSDTRGCPLTGHYWTMVNGDYQVMQSAFAYQLVYLKLVKCIRNGLPGIKVINNVQADPEASSG